MNSKRIFAVIAIILLVGIYIATFVIALCDFPGSEQLLKGFVLLDIAAPIFLWILLYIYRRFSDKN